MHITNSTIDSMHIIIKLYISVPFDETLIHFNHQMTILFHALDHPASIEVDDVDVQVHHQHVDDAVAVDFSSITWGMYVSKQNIALYRKLSRDKNMDVGSMVCYYRWAATYLLSSLFNINLYLDSFDENSDYVSTVE